MSTRRARRHVPVLAAAGLLLAVSACGASSAGAPSGPATAVAPASAPLQTVDLTIPGDLAASPVEAVREAGGWRIDWLTPGGGVQTTVIPAA